MIITLSGKAGAGKSTIARLLARRLKLKHYSIGDLTRKIAKRKRLSIVELAKYEEKHSSIDKELDKMQRELGKKKDNFVIDGRISYHFIPNSIKIFLEVEDSEGARRIFGDKRKTELAKSKKDLIRLIRARRASEIKRYKRLYGINPYNKSNYDFVIDTTRLEIPQVIKRVLKSIKSEQKPKLL